MNARLLPLLGDLARRRKIALAPDWQDRASGVVWEDGGVGQDDLDHLLAVMGWPNAVRFTALPSPEAFPLLVYSATSGWALADQWHAVGLVRVLVDGEPRVWDCAEHQVIFFDVELPLPVAAVTPSRAFEVFWQAIGRRRRMLTDAAIATVVLNVLTLGTSLYTMQVYDRVVPQAGLSTLWVLTFGVVIATLADLVLRIVRSVMLEKESAQIDAEVSAFFFARAQAVRLDARQNGVGTLAGQLRSYDQIRALLSSATVFAVADLPFALLFVWVIYLLAGPIALVPLVSFAIAIGISILFARLIRRQSDGVQVGSNRKNGLMVEALDAAETIKSTQGGWQMLARWNRLVAQVEVDDYDLKRLSAIAQAAGAAIQQIAYVALIAWGALEIIDGKITAGALIAASIISGRVNGPLVMQLPAMILQSSYARAALKGLDSFLQLPVDREPDGDYLRPAQLGSALQFEGVGFAYAGARSGITVPKLHIAQGERVAIIGPVGSGKTTLLKMMAGLFPPQQGTVHIDGLDMGHVAEDALRRHIGYLGQEFRLVNGSLREQLTLGLGDPGDDALIQAATATGLDRLITAHPKGLDLPISEGGRGLSGGQRALTGLTRLLLARPRVWLLDEPTAALDQEAEEQALSALFGALAPQDTLVFVTHKIQLLRLVQRVIVVVNGQIMLDGPTADVLEKLRPAAVPPKKPAKVKGEL